MDEDIDRTATGNEHRSPLPVIILTAQRIVCHQNGHKRSRQNHQDEAEEEESKHIVNLAEPQGRVDEVHLNS